MKNTAFVFLLSLAWSLALAQSLSLSKLDSLKQVCSIAKQDSTRAMLLVEIADNYRFSNQDSALLYVEKGLRLARQSRYVWGEIWGLCIWGAILHDVGNLPTALEKEFEALKVAEDSKNQVSKLGPYIFIGRIYNTLNDYPKALQYGRLEIELAEAAKEEASIIYAKDNLANIFEQTNQLDSALFYALQASDDLASTDLTHTPFLWYILGNIYIKLDDKSLALNYYHKSLHNAQMNNNYRVMARTCIKLAEFYKTQGLIDSSIYYAKLGFEKAQLNSHKSTMLESSELLSELYEPTNPKEALRYYKLATTTKEGLFGAGNIQTIQTMIAREEERQQKIELARKSYQNQLKQYGLLTGLGIVCLVAFLLYRNNRQKQQANVVLEKTLSNLKSTQNQLIQSEKLASLGELTAGIAHEIQNPLNFVNNFSELSVDLADELKLEIGKLEIAVGDKAFIDEILSDLSQNQQKINHHGKRAASIVTGMLQHARTSTGKKELIDLNALADEYLRLSYHGLRAKDPTFNAKMETDFDATIGKIEVVPQDIGRVFLNLLNNAFYAVHQRKIGLEKTPGDFEPQISIRTRRKNAPDGSGQAGQIEIRISDNGTGIPEAVKAKIFQPFFTTKPTGQGTGLGLSLAYDIVVKGHGGALEVDSTEGKGTTFTLRLPA